MLPPRIRLAWLLASCCACGRRVPGADGEDPPDFEWGPAKVLASTLSLAPADRQLSHLGVSSLAGALGTLKVFVYDLPPTFRQAPTCEGAHEEDCVFGKLLNVSVDATPGYITVRDVSQFALGRIFHFLFKTYRGRVADSQEADLLFVDAFNEPFFFNNCTELDPIPELKHLRRDSAHKHFLINPRSSAEGPDLCRWSKFDSQPNSPQAEDQLFAEMTKLALEAPSGAAHLHSIPFPSFRSGLHPRELEQYNAAVAGANRKYLVSAIWGDHGGSSDAMQQRRELQGQCNISDDCLFINLDGHRDDSNTNAVVSAMLTSRFCLQPEGDTPSRKSMVDAISLGCIPVLMTENQRRLWPWHVDWDDVSVHIDDYKGDVLGYLRSIPDIDIQHLQNNLRKLSDTVSYGTPPDHLAFDVALWGAGLHTRWRESSGG